MGNSIGFRPSDAVGATGKVILADGEVQEYEETTTVAELMLEHPQHVVVEFDPPSSFTDPRHRKNNNTEMVKKKLTPLPADKTLEPGKIYLMLPAKRASSKWGSAAAAVKSEEVRRMIWTATAALRSSRSYYEGIIPWFAKVCPVGGKEAAAAVAEKTVAPVLTAAVGPLGAAAEEDGGVRPEYLSRQLSGRGWKPSLDTITEKKLKRKVHHWLFF